MNAELIMALDNEWGQWRDDLDGWESGMSFTEVLGLASGNNMMCKYQKFNCQDCLLMDSTCSDNKDAIIHPSLQSYNEALEVDDIPTIIKSIGELLELMDMQRLYLYGRIVSSTGEVGRATGRTRPCALSGCRGIGMTTKWPDGKTTYPCTDGMTYSWGTWTIK